MAFLFTACGKASDTTPPNPTATPGIIPTVTINPGSGHLEQYAKITASSEASDEYTATNVADGQPGNSATMSQGFIWRPASDFNASWLNFKWNSQVRVTNIYLLDNPAPASQIKGGAISFSNSIDPSKTYADALFGELDDTAKSFTTVAGPSGPVDSLKIQILNSAGSNPGIAEVYIIGYRLDEAIASNNVAPYGHISYYSSVFDPIYAGTDTGLYRTVKIKDENFSSFWATNGNGASAKIQIDFDRAYTFEGIDLYDLPSGQKHFTNARIFFPKLTKEILVSKELADEKASTGNITETYTTDQVRIEFKAGDTGNTGLSEIFLKARYDL
jgi:hypothetical protein